MAIFNSFLYVYQRVTSLISRSRGPATGGPPHVRGTGPRNLVPKKRSCWCRKNMEKNTKNTWKTMENKRFEGSQFQETDLSISNFNISGSGQQAVTTGCDNRLWQQVSICPGGRYPTNSTCRSFTANLRYCPKYRKNQKKKPTWLTWQTKLNREIALNQPFCHKKNTSNWRLTCWGFARLRDQSNCSWLSRIGSERTMETTLEITYRSLHIFTRVNHSQPWYPPGLQNQSA